jgi:voltage-gated potassium channel
MSGRVIPYLAAAIASLAVLTGFVATLLDRRDFPTLGDGIWWSIVTLGTVGYGDIVPHTAWGRVLGGVVIVFGVTFISVLVATVTSFLLATEQEEMAAKVEEERVAAEDATAVVLGEIASRLTAIEARLESMTRSG